MRYVVTSSTVQVQNDQIMNDLCPPNSPLSVELRTMDILY
jgi:hypothetical protein